MDKIKVEVDIIRKSIFEFTVDAVLTPDGNIDEDATKLKASDAYDEAFENGSLQDHFSDEDYEFEIGDIVK